MVIAITGDCMRIFYLESCSFGGLGSHGHLYGKLTSRDEAELVDLRCTLSAAEAALFNKQDRTPASIRYRPGEQSARFHTRQRLITKAVETATALTGGEPFVLLDGRAMYMDPQPCIVAPAEFKARLDNLVQRWEAGGGWGVTSVQQQAAKVIEDEWDRLLGEIETRE